MAVGGPRKARAKPAKAVAEATPAPDLVKPASRKRRLFPRVTEAGVALVALLVSATAFLINGGLFLRGSDIALVEPDHFVMYVDQGPNGSDLYLAVPIAVINAASPDYGDVVTRASVTISPGAKAPGSFSYEAVMEPVVGPRVEEGVAACPQGARCIPAIGFYAIERPARLLDVPGGTSRSEYLSFWLQAANCAGSKTYCERLTSPHAVLEMLRAEERPTIRVHIEFHFDGWKTVTCRLPSAKAARVAIFDYVEAKGWAMPACDPIESRRHSPLPPSLN